MWIRYAALMTTEASGVTFYSGADKLTNCIIYLLDSF